jgi:hypothetical protein
MRELLGNPEAHRLLRRAYGSSYRWPQGFEGFRASVYYAYDEEHSAGSLEVHAPSDVRLGGALEGAGGRLEQELISIVVHRWHLPYEEADGQHRLTLDGSEHPLGRLVSVDDRLDSSYRVQGGHISQICRTVRGMRFSVHVQERTFTGDRRALPAHFCVSYWDTEQERLVRAEIYRDGYIAVGDIHLPLSRRITTAEDSGITTRQILLRDHELLGEGSANRKAG